MAAPDDAVDGPLAGLRVLELGGFIAGPFAGQLLGDYGAEVIKVEDPDGGDPMRRWGVVRDGESLWWPTIARNKRSVAIDVRDPAGQHAVRRLADRSDVLLENFRPGRLADFGLDAATLHRTNPGLIVVHVSGFGQTGPLADHAGFGSIGEAVGGLRALIGEPDRPPARCGISLGDSLAALFAVVGTLCAVTERTRSGRGQEVDVALYEAVAALMESSLADWQVAGVERRRTGSVLPGVAPSNAYPTGDGAHVLVAANADGVFRRLCQAMGTPELATDPAYATHEARGENMARLDDVIASWTRGLGTDEVLDVLAAHGVPSSRIYGASDVLHDAQYRARQMIPTITAASGVEIPTNGIVPKFSRSNRRELEPGPALGEDTVEVLRSVAGMSEEEIAVIIESGVAVSSGPSTVARRG